MVGLRFVVGAFGEFGAHGVELLLHRVNARESLAHFFLDREGVFKHHLLRKVAHAHILRHSYGAGSGALQSGYDFEHGAFARAVFAYEGYLVARVYDVTYVVEKGFGRELHRQVVN